MEGNEQPTLIVRAVFPSSLTSRRIPPASRYRRSRRLIVLCCCLGLFVLATSIFGFALYLCQYYNWEYHRDMALALDGARHLQTAEGLIKNLDRGSFDAHNVVQLQQEFAQAFTALGQVKDDLEQIPGIATNVPKYGDLRSAALKLLPLAFEVSQVGMVGCNAFSIVISGLNESFGVKVQGITMNDLTIIKSDFLISCQTKILCYLHR